MSVELSSISTLNIFASSTNTDRLRAEQSVGNFSDTFRNQQPLRSGSADLDDIFARAALQYDLPVNFLKAVAQVESNFRANVTSHAGAMGIMQLMPGTARHLGVNDPFDPEQNIFGGARYLRELLDRFEGDKSLALAAYNAGWPTVVRHGGIPPFAETQAYVPRVLSLFHGADITAGTVTWGDGAQEESAQSHAANTNRTIQANNNPSATAALTDALSQMMVMQMMNMQMGGGR